MLQFGGVLCHQAMLRLAPCSLWRSLLRIQIQSNSSSATTVLGVSSELSEEKTSEDVSPDTSTGTVTIRKSNLVAAAFASLRKSSKNGSKYRQPSLDSHIAEAETVDALLSVADSHFVSRRHALRVVSTLADWTTNNKVKLIDFEGDYRFQKLCRLLGKGLTKQGDKDNGLGGLGDLATVLGITGDDEAAKLVGSMSLGQMIRVMSSLGQKRRRSIPLLRSLAFNIGARDEKLDVKQVADLLYATSILNFPDQVLLEKTTADLLDCLDENKKPAVIGSILTSLGFLRYRDQESLDALAEWVVKNVDVCRSQDLTSLLLTLATLHYYPSNAEKLFEVVLLHVTNKEVSSPAAWLDVVWSLAILNKATADHVASVLSPDFIQNLALDKEAAGGNQNIAVKLKLLNVNAAAQFSIPGYKGPFLMENSRIGNTILTRSREKEALVQSVMDSLSNLLPSTTYLRTNVNTGMGFLLDGECLLDAQFNPLPVSQENKSKPAGKSDSRKEFRIAVVVFDYHDMCRGSQEPIGINVFNVQLLMKKGYKVLTVPYTEFNPREKLIRRVQYLEQQLKSLVKES